MPSQVILITGASRGIGLAAAQEAAKLGAQVALAARSEKEIERAARAIHQAGGTALAIRADVSQADDCRQLIERTIEQLGGLDALVNNSGTIDPIAPVAQADLEAWQRNWAVNLLAPVLLTALALPHLRQRSGRVINISSGAAGNAIGGWGAYSAAKAALNQVTQVLAAEEPAITALAVRPGLVDTQMQAEIRAKGAGGRMAERNYRMLSGMHAAGRLLKPEAPGKAIACLALEAPHAWSGRVLQWDDPEVEELVKLFR